MKTTVIAILSLFFFSESSHAWTRGQWNTGSVGEMEYLAYVPTTQAKTSSRLMVNLHGCAQKAEDLKAAGNWEGAAEKYQMVVVLPKVPRGGVIFGCWDYYGSNHNSGNRHNAPLIKLTESLIKDSELKINKDEVFISGLSSGGGQAFVMGCLRPDLFAGVGLNASPVIGSESSETHQPKITVKESIQLCRNLAAERADALKTQLTSIIVSDQDSIVNPVHSQMNAEVMINVYGATDSEKLDPADLTGPNIEGKGLILLDSDGNKRVSYFINNGLGHAWPAGNAASASIFRGFGGGGFINGRSVNYPMYLGKFFTENGLRKTQK